MCVATVLTQHCTALSPAFLAGEREGHKGTIQSGSECHEAEPCTASRGTIRTTPCAQSYQYACTVPSIPQYHPMPHLTLVSVYVHPMWARPPLPSSSSLPVLFPLPSPSPSPLLPSPPLPGSPGQKGGEDKAGEGEVDGDGPRHSTET